MAMDSVQHQEQELREAPELKSSLTEEDIDQIVHRNLPKAGKVTIRTYDPDGRKLGSCERIVEDALGLQEPGSERPSLVSEESVPEEGRSLGSLARRALEEAPWIPDEEEKVILVRAIKRLRHRLASESMSSRKQLERLEKAEVSPADNAVSQAHLSEAKSKAPPLHARCSNPMIVAEYQIAKGEELETPPGHTQRRRGILRTSSSLPTTGTNVPDLTQLPLNSTTAAAAFRGFSFPEGDSPDSKRSSSPASPRSPRNPLRLPGNLKPRMSMVSIADEDEEELVEIDEGSRTPPTPRKSESLSESSTTALETARSSVARSSVFLKSPRHSLANMFRWKRSEVSMGERQRSDLELGHLLGHLLLDAQRRGSIPELLRKEEPAAAPAEPDFCLDAEPLLSTPRQEKLESQKRTPADTEGQELQEGTSQPTTPVTPATEGMATTASEEEEQRCREWMDGYLQTAREENEAQMSRLQESLQESLRKFDEKMDAFTQRFSDLEEEVLHSKEKREPETDGLKDDVHKQQNALKSNVRSLQIQMEALEQAQGELLQQLRKAESRCVESLEKQVAVHQETLDEHCRDLADQLGRSPTAQPLGSPGRPEAVVKLEEAFAKLLEQHDQLEAQLGQTTSRQEQSHRSLEDLVRQNCMSTEDLGMTVSSLSELHERISIGFEGTKEELLEQMRVLRDSNDAKFAAVQDASSQQERIFHQLQSSLKELDKKLVGEEEARASELQKLQDQQKEDQSRLAAELNVLRESNDGKFAALQDATSQQERICNQLQSNFTKKLVSAEEARASELQRFQDQQKENQARLEDQLNEWTGKFDQLDIRFHNFEDAMETRRAAQQREVDRLFTELQRSFDKLEGTQKTMLADTLPEVASALVQPIQRDVGNLKENLESFQSTIKEQGIRLDKEIQSVATAQQASLAACEALKVQLQKEMREVVTSESDAVLKALTGKVSHEEQERVSSMTAVRKDLNELRENLTREPLLSLSRAEGRGMESWKTTPSAGAMSVSVSPARVTRSPFAITGVSGMESLPRRKDMCRRKFASSTGPGQRTPR